MENIDSGDQFTNAMDTRSLDTFIRPSISSDAYTAEVTVLRHDPDAVFGNDTIRQFLSGNNITYGIQDEKVEEVIEAVKNGPDKKVITVAKGAPLEEGKDGCEDYRFRIKLEAGKIDENKIDFKERGLINNVKAGQVLAMVTKEIPGKPGMRVDGKVNAPREVKTVKVPTAGVNVTMSVKGNTYTYTADIDGHARLVFKEIQVNEDFILVGDLDYTKGNIDFVGNVIIKGTVKSGFTVKAGGDVLVGGDIEPEAVVEAANDVTVKGVIKCGKKKSGKVIAGRHVTARRAINSFIVAGGNVSVKEQIMDTVVHCDGKFASTSAKIIGCKIEAISGIYAHVVGIEDSSSTNYLYAGKSIEAIERVKKIDSELERIKNEKALLAKSISKDTTYKDSDFEHLDVSEQEKIKRLGAARSKHIKMLNEEEDGLQKEREELLPRMKTNPHARIQITGGIHPSCFIHIGDKEIRVLDKKKGACTLDQDGKNKSAEEKESNSSA